MTATGQLMFILNALSRNLVESTNIHSRICKLLMEVLVWPQIKDNVQGLKQVWYSAGWSVWCLQATFFFNFQLQYIITYKLLYHPTGEFREKRKKLFIQIAVRRWPNLFTAIQMNIQQGSTCYVPQGQHGWNLHGRFSCVWSDCTKYVSCLWE